MDFMNFISAINSYPLKDPFEVVIPRRNATKTGESVGYRGTCFVNCIERRGRRCEWKKKKFIGSRVNKGTWNFSICIKIGMKAFPERVALDSQTSLLKKTESKDDQALYALAKNLSIHKFVKE